MKNIFTRGFLQAFEKDINLFKRLFDPFLISILFKLTNSGSLFFFKNISFPLWIIVFLFALLFLNNTRLYKSLRQVSIKELFSNIFKIWLYFISFFSLFIYSISTFLSELPKKEAILIWAIMCFFTMFFNNFLISIILRVYRKSGHNQRKILFWGNTNSLTKFKKEIDINPWLGYKVAYWFCPDVYGIKEFFIEDKLIKSKGGLKELKLFLKKKNYDLIFYSNEDKDKTDINTLIAIFGDTTSCVSYFIPWANSNMNFSFNNFGNFYFLNLWSSNQTYLGLLSKRTFDIIFSILIILILSPIYLLIFLILLNDKSGDVFYIKERSGLDNKTFKMFKFRTMIKESNNSGFKLVEKNDKRITKVGRYLRKYSLDELPQFFNVLKGDMSIVGPRPHAVEVDKEFRKKISGYMQRYGFKPGITGLAQIKGFRGDDNVITLNSRIKEDLRYQKEWSLLLDLKIIIKTVSVLFSDKAY